MGKSGKSKFNPQSSSYKIEAKLIAKQEEVEVDKAAEFAGQPA